ncbi:hypothetical protein Taro_018515 [Colocasia esculenta]|uniref:Class II aldolase/adducin N-terminal domain-containing protein n=1 Tax=Colocasia esculenta TaxID=4460 RepID=A0A843URL9_COLES|nr:hypothetical protein [Colocasia esculenta]
MRSPINAELPAGNRTRGLENQSGARVATCSPPPPCPPCVPGPSAAMAAASMAANGGIPALSSQAYLESWAVNETRALVSELCRQFYTLGWVSGTGGSITIKVHEDSIPKPQQLIVMSPSGVQKERMVPEDMYVLSSCGAVRSSPAAKPYPHKPPKCTDCAPLFMKFFSFSVRPFYYNWSSLAPVFVLQAYQMRNAGAVIHSHGMESCLVTMLLPSAKEFRITHMEMIKGIQGHGYYDELVVPIIENTAHERELTESLAKAVPEGATLSLVQAKSNDSVIPFFGGVEDEEVEAGQIYKSSEGTRFHSTPCPGVFSPDKEMLEFHACLDKKEGKELMGEVQRITEEHFKGLTEKLGVSYDGVEKGIRGAVFMIQKRWLAALAREAKKDKSQGIGGGEKRRIIKEMVRYGKVDILCLQETKLEADGETATVAECYENSQVGGIWVPTFRRNLSLEETAHLQEMFGLLTQFRLTANMADRHDGSNQIWATRSPLKIEEYPKTTAVLVRNHGIYVWGDSWISAKTQAECYHYLFDAALKLHSFGLDWSTPLHGPLSLKSYGGTKRKQIASVEAEFQNGNRTSESCNKCIVLDIEGTTTPISFVTDVLFPYARDNVRKHLTSTYDTDETQDDIKLLRAQGLSKGWISHRGFVPSETEPTGTEHRWESHRGCGTHKGTGGTPTGHTTPVGFPQATQHRWGLHRVRAAPVKDDLEQGIPGSVPIPPDDAGKDEVIESLVTNVEAMIKADRKITALKQLQGHIWRTGFENKELQGVVFDDVPEALEKWHGNGIKVYIYSSGSREAQRLLFGNTAYGDLRKYLCGFFDTTIGNKRESRSYFEISQSVGVDKTSQILFLTDVYQEAVAAKAAGEFLTAIFNFFCLEVIISVRPGNGPLPDEHGFATITSFAEI